MILYLTFPYLRDLVQSVFANAPWEHLLAIGTLSLALSVFFLIHKRLSTYGAICLGLSVFLSLCFLDAAVVIRWGDGVNHVTGFSLAAEYHRLIHGGEVRRTEMLANVAVFVPFGFFLLEFLSTTKRFCVWRRIGLATLYAFGLSLLIESLQLIFRLGVFEITDLVLNTAGGFVGAGMALCVRRMLDKNPYVKE